MGLGYACRQRLGHPGKDLFQRFLQSADVSARHAFIVLAGVNYDIFPSLSLPRFDGLGWARVSLLVPGAPPHEFLSISFHGVWQKPSFCRKRQSTGSPRRQQHTEFTK